MLKVLLFLSILSYSLYAQSGSWYSNIDTKVEAGIYLPQLGGNIENIIGSSNFSKDFSYHNTKASYFSLEIQPNYNYMPNLYLAYFNMQDSKSATLTHTVHIADKDFDSNVSTTFKYQLFNATLYQNLFKKGHLFRLFGKRHYTGDIEFDVGLSLKLFQWHYEVKDLTNLSRKTAWIDVHEFITLPYIGVKYYLYNMLLYANANALAFSKAKSNAYQIGIDYMVVSNLYLNASYLYEEFQVTEREDLIDFKTNGYKFGFKYLF